jgi:hypothetical protein
VIVLGLHCNTQSRKAALTGGLRNMKLSRRRFLRLVGGAAAVPGVCCVARAQSYPTRPIRLVVPFPPGGVFDFVGRPLAERMRPFLGTMFY